MNHYNNIFQRAFTVSIKISRIGLEI